MAYAPAKAPSVPSSAPITARGQAEFQQVKQQLSQMMDDYDSWELAPSGFSKVRMKFTEAGSEAQAKTYLAAISK